MHCVESYSGLGLTPIPIPDRVPQDLARKRVYFMCQFCKDYGEGKKWYLLPKNYSQERYKEVGAKDKIIHHVEHFEEDMTTGLGFSEKLRLTDPVTFQEMLPMMQEQQRKLMWGQIILLQEAEQILDMAVKIVRLPCLCRSMLLGRSDCMFEFGFFMFESKDKTYEGYPGYSEHSSAVTKDEAKRLLRDFEEQGMIHTIWTFCTPYIVCMCNCTAADCVPVKIRAQSGMSSVCKGEYVGRIDLGKCTGCRECIKTCNFGSISYSTTLKKCYIDEYKCTGCGLCYSRCPESAVVLTDRNTMPELAGVW